MTVGLGANFNKPYRSKFAVDYRGRVVHDSRKAPAPIAKKRPRASPGGVRPSIDIADQYRRKLIQLINEMNHSFNYWIGSTFKKTQDERELINPLLAYDTAANDLEKAINLLRKRWQRKFDILSTELAEYFSKAVQKRSDADLKKILKKSGIAVEFKLTKPMKEILSSIVNENVTLIKSIPQQYLNQVEGATYRAVSAGRDLEELFKAVQNTHQVTKKRAELIARDQNNKATGQLQKVRYEELGIEEAIWRHSHAGRDKRPSHVKNDGQKYRVAEGWYDPDEKQYITPGYLINCRCYSVPILP